MTFSANRYVKKLVFKIGINKSVYNQVGTQLVYKQNGMQKIGI